MRFKYAFLLALLGFYTIKLTSQVQVNATYKRGFLAAHDPKMLAMRNTTNAFEVCISNSVDSLHPIQKIGKPSFGLFVGFINHTNQAINGNNIYAGVCILKKISSGLKHTTNLRVGTGIGYSSAIFNTSTNRLNQALGTNLNGMLQIGLQYQHKLTHNWQMFTSLDLTHLSNGNLAMPNLGINMPALGIGVLHVFPRKSPLNPSIDKRVHTSLFLDFGLKLGYRQTSIDDTRKIGIGILDIGLLYPQSAVARWRAAINVFYDRTYFLEDFAKLKNKISGKNIEVALVGGHEYRFGKFGFTTDLGFYVVVPQNKKRMYFEGLGIRYYPNKNIYVSTRLKVHLTSADYFEWGLGYTLETKQKVKPGFANGWRWVGKKVGL